MITNKDLLYSTRTSTQYSVMTYMGIESKNSADIYLYIYNWFTLLYYRNWHNIVNQLYFNKKKLKRKLKKRQGGIWKQTHKIRKKAMWRWRKRLRWCFHKPRSTADGQQTTRSQGKSLGTDSSPKPCCQQLWGNKLPSFKPPNLGCFSLQP